MTATPWSLLDGAEHRACIHGRGHGPQPRQISGSYILILYMDLRQFNNGITIAITISLSALLGFWSFPHNDFSGAVLSH